MVKLWIHGRGNAWPVALGETHPFYDRKDPRDLSNAAYSLLLEEGKLPVADVLVDAGHGTIQSLLSVSNRIPDCICLTHGHMDHTLSVDWVVQSFWRKHEKSRRYPIYSTAPVYDFLVQSYPQLVELTNHHPLVYGEHHSLSEAEGFELTSFPVFHGQSAYGASMLLFSAEGKRILFTGDLFSPLLRRKDYDVIRGLDMIVVDTNNRFPWPRTNHWSFAGIPEKPLQRSEPLNSFLENLEWGEVSGPQLLSDAGSQNRNYFSELKAEWSIEKQPFTILEFLKEIDPKKVVLVHYSGTEDARYHRQDILNTDQLQDWAQQTTEQAGINSRIIVPRAGDLISL